MGMLFSTKATTKMLQVVNDAFDNDSMTYWTTPPGGGKPTPMDFFKVGGPDKLPLPDIAKEAGIFGGTGQGSPKDKRFQKWLKGLERVGLGNTICNQVFQGLSNPDCAEVYFVLVPSNTITVAPNPPMVGSTLVITLSTVEVDDVPAFVQKHLDRLAARRAARAKKKA